MQFRFRIVRQPLPKNCEHLFGTLSGRANNIDVAKLRFILPVEFRQRAYCFLRGVVRAGLFLRGPTLGCSGSRTDRLVFSNLGVIGERLQPVVRFKRPPDAIRERDQLVRIRERTLGSHATGPLG